VLSEPAPDAAYSTAAKVLAEASAKDQSGKGSVEYSRSVVELTHRHQTTMVLREALFRLSELHVNGALADGNVRPTVIVMYTEALRAIVKLAEADASRAEAQVIHERVQALQKVRDALRALRSGASEPGAARIEGENQFLELEIRALEGLVQAILGAD
jgi:hypothetical protein